VLLQVQDLPSGIADLNVAGRRFSNEMEVGPPANRFKLKIPRTNREMARTRDFFRKRLDSRYAAFL
jgi:hypothetical protein